MIWQFVSRTRTIHARAPTLTRTHTHARTHTDRTRTRTLQSGGQHCHWRLHRTHGLVLRLRVLAVEPKNSKGALAREKERQSNKFCSMQWENAREHSSSEKKRDIRTTESSPIRACRLGSDSQQREPSPAARWLQHTKQEGGELEMCAHVQSTQGRKR